MEIDLYTRIGLGVAGLLVLVLINTDITYIVSRLLSWEKSDTHTTTEKDFLTIINLWYKLKESCEKNNFIEASTKLDEVFPLLNRSSNE